MIHIIQQFTQENEQKFVELEYNLISYSVRL
jgi:hypothetical protein